MSLVVVSRLERPQNPYGHITENQHIPMFDQKGSILNPLHTTVLGTKLAKGLTFRPPKSPSANRRGHMLGYRQRCLASGPARPDPVNALGVAGRAHQATMVMTHQVFYSRRGLLASPDRVRSASRAPSGLRTVRHPSRRRKSILTLLQQTYWAGPYTRSSQPWSSANCSSQLAKTGRSAADPATSPSPASIHLQDLPGPTRSRCDPRREPALRDPGVGNLGTAQRQGPHPGCVNARCSNVRQDGRVAELDRTGTGPNRRPSGQRVTKG